MKTIKSLVLGSAAVLVAVGGAQAADLPVKAKAVEYVKVCSLYGAGFYYIPGTDTCIKLGGYLRVDVAVNENLDNIGNVSGQAGAKNRLTNGYTWRSREDLNIDTRTQTEYGVLRTYFDTTFSWTSDSYLANTNGSTVYAPLSVPGSTGLVTLPNNAGAGNGSYGTVGVYFAFIQFAGFTIGKAISQFSMPWVNYPANNFDGLVGGGGTVTGVNQFTYTWDLGGGNTFALSAQDQAAYFISGNNNLGGNGLGATGGVGTNYGAGDTAGFISPDFVAMFRSDNSAYTFQVSTALHDNHVGYYGTSVAVPGFPASPGTEISGHANDLWGYAVAGGFTIKNLPTGAGDTFNAQAVFTHGATRYNIQDLATLYGTPLIFGSTSNPLAYQSFAFNAAPDTVFVNGGSQHAITTYGGQAGYNHNWNPYWSSGFYGAAAAVRYDNFSKATICGPNGNFGGTLLTGNVVNATDTGPGVCNPDYEIYQAGIITRWTPVKGLTFSGDLTWSHIQQHNDGLAVFSSSTIGKPTALYEFKNQDNVLLLLRAQRNW